MTRKTKVHIAIKVQMALKRQMEAIESRRQVYSAMDYISIPCRRIAGGKRVIAQKGLNVRTRNRLHQSKKSARIKKYRRNKRRKRRTICIILSQPALTLENNRCGCKRSKLFRLH